jgi:hypothetical protein
MPVVNWVCTTLTVWVLTERYAKVPVREMLGLIGAAWLFNMLPLRLGMIGRVTYHKKYHGMRVRDCAKVMLQALVCSAIALTMLVAGVVLYGVVKSLDSSDPAMNGVGEWGVLLAVIAGPPLVMLAGIAVMMRKMGARSAGGDFEQAWRWPAALLVRYVDMLVWFVRYAVVFAMIGYPLPPQVAAGVTVTAQAAMVTPVQFGLREWVVGMTAAAAGVNETHEGGEGRGESEGMSERTRGVLKEAGPGLVADACMRAAELAIVIPVGVISTVWMMRSMQRRRGREENANRSGK